MIPENLISVSYRCPKCDVLRGLCSVNNYHHVDDGMDKTVIELKCTKCRLEIGTVDIFTPTPVEAEKKTRKKRSTKSFGVGVGELTEPAKQ